MEKDCLILDNLAIIKIFIDVLISICIKKCLA